MSAEQDEQARRLAETAAKQIANALGVDFDPAFVVEKAMMFVDIVKGGTWKKVLQMGEDAASKVNTLDDAIDASRNRK